MKLATLDDGTRDGCLVLVSRDLGAVLACDDVAGTLQEALEDWDRVSPLLAAMAERLDHGGAAGARPFDAGAMKAPLPRAWQWLDGSAFSTHGQLMQLAYDLPPVPSDIPLMYQGLSHRFAAGHEDMVFPSAADGIDFEAELAVIVDDVPQGLSPEEALGHIRLVMLVNDWSLRVLGAAEMRTGFGWVQAKPACSAAPVAVTPDELGDRWKDGRVHLPVMVHYQGGRFGEADAGCMDFGFHELIAHAARTRTLCAGTIIGSGTISNPAYNVVGSSCIAERRAIEKIERGAPHTPFMQDGEAVRIEVRQRRGSLFGAIDQRVVVAGRD
ncbi:fumarylacetoacetate hydrolase family protein [Sphingobium sp. V4]|uniref:fumarylacetoacetate hydrolase family protein n=1 Tax=Sphingobium sp. V4 TaxID=3038927 RepID=UPI0025583986|nr:fumarylacetoacetate hydrolase family protein [Sphingobium sp. V4]WIW88050.1 fumarylacetoacetate hydrolase family protein [Sphingobium sp. V4]